MARTSPADPSRPRVPWASAWLGLLVGLALALVMFAPARWLAFALAQASDGQILLQAVRGTVWNGSAQLVITAGQGSRDATSLPSRIEWTLGPAASSLQLSLTTACCTPRPLTLTVQPHLGADTAGLRIDVAQGAVSQWPATLLAGLGTPWNTLQLGGQLQLSTRDLAFTHTRHGWQLTGHAELVARDMTSRLSTLRPMGSYRIRIDGGAPPTIEVSTIEGGLQLAGTGRWVQSRLRFTGQAATTPDREEALSNLLNLIGRREGARSVITLG